MLTKETLEKIHSGEITTRKQLYALVGGRSRKLLAHLNANGILIPKRWTKKEILQAIKDLEQHVGRRPRATDASYSLRTQAIRKFGTWNEALFQACGGTNQSRYKDTTDEQLLDKLKDFIATFSRIPQRDEFDGKDYPYWEAYTERFKVRRWVEVVALVDLSNISYFAHHGWGKVHEYKGTIYLSHGEYLIGKYLTDCGIEFEKEIPYGNSNHVFDFYLPQYAAYVEYYGIGTADYKSRVEEKRNMYNGRTVIEIFKHENTIKRIVSEVQRLQLMVVDNSDKV